MRLGTNGVLMFSGMGGVPGAVPAIDLAYSQLYFFPILNEISDLLIYAFTSLHSEWKQIQY